MNGKLFFKTIALATVLAGCASNNVEHSPFSMSYATPDELEKRQSPVPLIPGDSSGNIDFKLQYPSGIKDDGMITSYLDKNSSFKNKYFSKYTDTNNTEWIRISLDASDQGKSPNGSSVRVELAQISRWALQGTHSFTYTFFGNCSNVSEAKFTVGQFLASKLPNTNGKPTDRPLCRIEAEQGKIVAKIRNYYEADKVDKINGDPIKIELGKWIPSQETTIKIQTEEKKLSIFRDGEKKGSISFTEKVCSDERNYFKAGIYYQNKDSTQIFTEIFLKNLIIE